MKEEQPPDPRRQAPAVELGIVVEVDLGIFGNQLHPEVASVVGVAHHFLKTLLDGLFIEAHHSPA
ncbi:hypothetical protein RRF57_009276 [Xylaria bambusicola]|uniref:Uncharacterized protein n=1 Tax=Xylaria bambusicola TaxID=326684 RepID=A0AAN7Z8V4_9PEZI